MNTEELLKVVIDALEDIKAVDIRVLDVRDRTSITDVMVIASGKTDRVRQGETCDCGGQPG